MIKKIVVFVVLALVPLVLAQFPFWADLTRSIGASVGNATYGLDMVNYLQGYSDAGDANRYAELFNWAYYAPLVMLGLYYFAIDKSRYRETKFYVMALMAGALVAAVDAFFVGEEGRSIVRELAETGVTASIILALLVLLLAVVLGFLQTFALRPFSTNCAKTPFR